MLYYLDNALNFRDGFTVGDRLLGINENYSRELMELHTLGVDGGYDQDDVIEVARCFTGWTIDRRYQNPDGFLFVGPGHDGGEKLVMDELSIAAGRGIEDGDEVIAFLAAHPATAERISRLLIERFVSEEAPAGLVAEVRDVYLATDGDLREVVRKILLSDEFLDAGARRSKVKRPQHFLVSAVRATGLELDPTSPRQGRFVALALEEMGETPYLAAPPTGYPDSSGFWASAGPLLTRFDAAREIALEAPLPEVDAEAPSGDLVDALAELLLPGGLGDRSRGQLVAYVDGLDRSGEARVRETAAMILSSPEFLLH